MPDKRSLIVHPILFALYFFLHFYANNITTVYFPMGTILQYLAITLVMIGIVWGALTYFGKNAAAAAIMVSVLVLLFFSYGHIYEWIYFRDKIVGTYVSDPSILLRSHLIIMLPWALLAIATAMILIAKGKNAYRLTSTFNFMAGVLLVFPMITIITNSGLLSGLAGDEAEGATDVVPLASTATGYDDALPDIYYIILDAYSRDDVLQEYYDYDNPFTDFLASNNFYVAPESNGNYLLTLLALPSSLNMRYLVTPDDTASDPAMQRLIRDSLVCRSFREIGYKYIAFETVITGDAICVDDRVANTVNNFNTIFLKTTFIRPFISQGLWIKPTYEDHLSRVDLLIDVADDPDTTFTFAHFILPHEPFVFDRDGNQIYMDLEGDTDKVYQAYVDQLAYTNVLFERVVTEILAKSEVPPIIIIQGDHGFTRQNSQPLLPGYFERRLPILNAYHLPYGGDSVLYPSITPVNSFRVIMNYYFGADLEYLEDGTFFLIDDPKRFDSVYDWFDRREE